MCSVSGIPGSHLTLLSEKRDPIVVACAGLWEHTSLWGRPLSVPLIYSTLGLLYLGPEPGDVRKQSRILCYFLNLEGPDHIPKCVFLPSSWMLPSFSHIVSGVE